MRLKSIYILVVTLVLSIPIRNVAIAQEKAMIVSINPIEEETVMPYYDYEHIPDFTYEEVERRIAEMDTDMPFELNETIFAFIDYFTVRNRDYTRMVLERQDLYFPMFDTYLSAHNMPEDIKYLSIIESGLNPKAKSRVGAMGLWQFMPATGKEFKLYYNSHVDDRLDPERSTEAAIRYLKALNRRYDNWELALAAYNCGPGNVNKAIRRSGGKRTFWEIYRYLPRETRSYIPQFQAIMYVLRYAEEHNLILEEPAYPVAYEKVDIGNGYTLGNLAKHTGLCIEDLEYLNPSLLKSKVPDFGKAISINVPKSGHKFISDNQEWIIDSLKIETERYLAEMPEKEPVKPLHSATYRVRSGDVLGKIAGRYGVSVSQLKSWNGLYSNTIKIGQVLHIHQDKAAFEKNLASTQTISTNSNGGKLYTVQPGDSLWLISKKLEGVTIDQLKKLNNLNNNQIKPGQKLIIG